MAKLGKIWTDDPAYSTGTIEPNSQGASIGTVNNPFVDGHFSGTVTSSVTSLADIIYSANPFQILSDTVDGADNRAAEIGGGGAATVARGAFEQWFGNENVSTPGYSLTVSGNIANSKIVERLGVASAVIEWQNASSGAMWTMNNSGQLLQNVTNGGDILFNKTASILGINTTDGADNKLLAIVGGGALSNARGGTALFYGNEAGGTPGAVLIQPGNVASSKLILQCGVGTGTIEFQNHNSGAMWSLNATGVLTGDATNGGAIVFAKATSGIELQSGANGRTGTFTLNGATPVVVGNTSLAAGDMILIERDTIGGTPLSYELTARTNGTSFTVTGSATDTSGMRYALIRIN